MGYTKRPNSEIIDFQPDDDDRTMYIKSGAGNSLEEIMDRAKKKWPDAELRDITITSEKIHTHCIYYDLYDPSDYTDFIVLTLE